MTRLERLYGLKAEIDREIKAEIKAEAMRAEQRERRAALRARRGWAKCGTDGGYYRHVRTLKERACRDCRKAHSEAEAQRSARRREVA